MHACLKRVSCKPLNIPQTRILTNLNFQDNLGVVTDPQNKLKNMVCKEKMRSSGDLSIKFRLGGPACLHIFKIFCTVTIMYAPSLHS